MKRKYVLTALKKMLAMAYIFLGIAIMICDDYYIVINGAYGFSEGSFGFMFFVFVGVAYYMLLEERLKKFGRC